MGLIAVLLVLSAGLAVFFFVFLFGTMFVLIPWLVTGLIIGWLASLIIQSTLGTLGNIGVGLAGSVIGGVVYTMVTRNTAGGPLSPTRIGVGVVGAVVLLAAFRLLRGSPNRL
ncbi:MAG: hypothetical protein AAB289_16955 [Chloroflexota bacterium]